MTNNGTKEKVLHIDTIEGALSITWGTVNSQLASYGLRLASLELDNIIIGQQSKQAFEEQSRILKATDIVNRIRGGH